MNIPVAFKAYIKLFQILDNHGQLWSPSGQFLGLLSSNPDHPKSIINPVGAYGSPFSPTSIQNPQSLYGGSNGIYSPYNLNCINPPAIFYKNKPILVLTWNLNVFTNGLNIVDADLMVTIYEELSRSKHDPTPLGFETIESVLAQVADTIQDSKKHRK
jgi:hypothetical protein